MFRTLETWPVVRGLVYHPVRRTALNPEAVGLDPRRIRAVEFTTDDGLTLRGWHCVGAPRVDFGAAPHQQFQAGLIYFPGRGGHRGYRLLEISQLIDAGAEVLLVDYRGYGDNPGRPSEPGLARDARAIWNGSQTLPGWVADRTVLYGESLGGALAAQLAADLCHQQNPPGGLILRSAFTSMTEAARHYQRWARWFIPEGWYPSLQRIPRVTCPVLALHGTADEVVPYEMGQRLFAAVPARSRNQIDKEWVPFPEAGHNGLAVSHAPLLRASVARFLGRVATVAASPLGQSGCG